MMTGIFVPDAGSPMERRIGSIVLENNKIEFIHGVSSLGEDCGDLAGAGLLGLPIRDGLAEALEDIKPCVVADRYCGGHRTRDL